MFWNRFSLMCNSNATSPNAIAKKIGVSNATCTKWKNGSIPNGETLVRLSIALNCSVDYLLGRTDNPKSHTGEEANAQSTLISLIGRLTAEEQELITAQIRGILASRSAEPTQKIWLAASSTDDQAPAIVEASKAKIKAAQEDHSLQNEEDI